MSKYMANCKFCGASKHIDTLTDGVCFFCRSEVQGAAFLSEDEAKKLAHSEKVNSIVITTESHLTGIEKRFGVVASEVVFGMNVFKDIMANVRDLVGGRSGVVQKTFEDARKAALAEIADKGVAMGANAIIAVHFDYHSISTGSSVNMMMVAVTGTAVQLTI